jgi:hypothetical protein
MERNCKNCSELIYAGKSHCANCGCKWLENRITMKQVGNDFADMYIGIDTKFVRTFLDLFKKPEAVILGYMNGRRVNYMDAVRYLLLAMFVTGIYTFVLKNTGIIDDIMASQTAETIRAYEQMGMDSTEALENSKYAQNMSKQVFEFQGFFLLVSIPFLAVIGRITFWNKRYFNFTEQMVFYMYTYGHSIIVTTPFTILTVYFFPDALIYIGFVSLPLMYLFNMYCYKRCFGMDNSQIILKTLISFGVIILSGLILFILGVVSTVLYMIATKG